MLLAYVEFYIFVNTPGARLAYTLMCDCCLKENDRRDGQNECLVSQMDQRAWFTDNGEDSSAELNMKTSVCVFSSVAQLNSPYFPHIIIIFKS